MLKTNVRYVIVIPTVGCVSKSLLHLMIPLHIFNYKMIVLFTLKSKTNTVPNMQGIHYNLQFVQFANKNHAMPWFLLPDTLAASPLDTKKVTDKTKHVK